MDLATLNKALTIQVFLDERLEFWQKELRLSEWILTAAVVNSGLDKDCVGSTKSDPDMKIASIKLLHPNCINDEDALCPYSVEHTLVHELIHLHLGHADEFSVNAIAGALISLHYSNE